MSLAAIEARACARFAMSAPRRRGTSFLAAENGRRIADLKADGIVIPLSQWLGHNNGPDWDRNALFSKYCWKKVHQEAWKPLSLEIAARRAYRAKALGLTHRQYTLEIMERGRYLDEDAAARLRQKLKVSRKCSLP